MVASSITAAASGASTPLFVNRFQVLEGLPDDGDVAKPDSKFQAQGVYKPPHMRNPSESVESTVGSDPMANGTSVCPAHGPNLDRERKRISRPHTPHVDSTSGSGTFGVGELKKKMYEELLNVRKAMKEMETIEKEFLEEEARFEQEVQALRRAGLTDEEIQEVVGLDSESFPPRLPSTKPLDVNVGICFHVLVSGRGTHPGFNRTWGQTWRA